MLFYAAINYRSVLRERSKLDHTKEGPLRRLAPTERLDSAGRKGAAGPWNGSKRPRSFLCTMARALHNVVMNLRRYVFHSDWEIDAPVDDVYAVIRDQRTYIHWWKEIREATDLGRDTCRFRARSSLPIYLEFTASLESEDREQGLLLARLTGDLEGFVRWQQSPRGNGTHISYDQEVVTNKLLLNVLSPIARPAFRANHWLMMRNGEKGLQTFMSGVGFGSSAGPDEA